MIRKTLACAIIASLAVLTAVVAAEMTPKTVSLDGSSWKVVVTPDPAAAQKGEKPFDDTLVFKDGKVSMTTCMKYGFEASSYTAMEAEKGVKFKTEQVSKSEGHSQWKATIEGDKLTGKMSWKKSDGTMLQYSVTGTRVQD